MRRITIGIAAVLIAVPSMYAASPNLGGISPRGWQRGTETILLFNGARLTDAQEILFYYPGITVNKLEVVNDNQIKATVKIDPNCRLGEHAMRVRTASGISELQSFYVGALPIVEEKEPNSDFAAPQKIALNVTVHGVVQCEDVDYYQVECKKGQRLSAEIEGMRLGSGLFDPYVAILDMKRFELAANDDHALTWQDSVASIVAPADGSYVVMVRESAYTGSGGYRLHVGTFPRPTATIPAGGKLGEEVEVKFLGDAAGEFTQKVKLPAAPEPRFGLFAQDAGGIAPSPNVFRLSSVGNVIEAEPNDAHAQATAATLPLAFNGVIAKPGDVDHFKFTAKKGETYDVHCYARRIRSQLDPVMYLYVMGGGAIVGNDDSAGPDSYFRVTFPEDKEYVISVTDHLGKGGPDYAYRIEFTPVQAGLAVSIPKVNIFSQERQTIPVPRGNRYATIMQVGRSNVGGEMTLAGDALPKGVTLQAENVAANLDIVPVVFEAAADAPVAGNLANIIAKPADPNVKVQGGFAQVIELVTGGPGQSVYWRHEVNQAAVAVTQEVPFKISIVEPKAPLVQNGSMQLKVIAERKPDFKAPITVQMLFNPPGVGSASAVTIPEGQNEVLYPINANGGAQVRRWKIAMLGTATVGNGPVHVSTQLATLEIAPPFVQFALERSAVEQGKETEVFCKVTHTTPFVGAGKVKLIGLPHLVTALELDITKDTKEFAFKVTTDKTSPAGTHKNLFCQLVITHNGEPVVHSLGSTELRIDPPPPPKPMAAAPPPMPVPMPVAKPPEAQKPPEKRLTRLEKLRLEQQEREKAAKGETPKPPVPEKK